MDSLSSIRTSNTKAMSVGNNNNSNDSTQQQQNNNNSNNNNNISLQQVLKKKYKTNRDVEAAIVHLGRKGRTDEALQLYHAIWTLDGLRQQYKLNQLRRQKQEQQQLNNSNSNNNNNNNGQEEEPSPSQEMIQFMTTKSKLRPTTRLMNAAIDACARSQPLQARQSTAFEIFQSATSPLNADKSKKPGGALSPNVFTFGSLLACCARNGDVDTSLELLRVLEEGAEYPDVVLNEVIYSTVISACERAREPNVELALEVLHRGISTLALLSNGSNNHGGGSGGSNGGGANPKRNKGTTTMGVVGYNAAISTMARAGQWKMAVQLLGEMILHSRSSPAGSRSNPNFSHLESIRCEGEIDDGNGTARRPPLIQHVTIVASSSDRDDDDIDDDSTVIVPEPDGVTFGTVLAACERSGEWEELLHVAEAAKEYGVKLDGMSLTSVLHSCQQLGMADEALEYLELMKRLGDDGSDGEGCGFVQMTNGRQRKGAKQPLCGPDGVAYHLAISACARSPGGHRWRDGIQLLNEMWEAASESNGTSCAPDVVAYTAAIAGCSEAGEYTHAMALISEMRRKGIKPNVVTLSAVINACATASAKMASMRREEDDYGVLKDVRTPMMRALRLLEAMKSPNSYVRPNIVTYNAAIRACAEGLNLEGAFDLLRQLKEDELEPTIVTYGSLMTACERVGDIEAASKVFRMVKEEEEKTEESSGGGEGDEDNDQERLQVNEIIYGAAISCCRKARQPERALLLLRKMISEQLSPNTATFNTVIAALSEGEPDSKTTKNDLLWEKALAVYRVMKSNHAPHGVMPNRQTYNILIRCFSANLQPGNAEMMLMDMLKAGFVPDVDLYTVTVRSHERCGNLMKALGLMESMREVGYDFYEIKVLNAAFKNGVKILNQVGKGISSVEEMDFDDEEEDDYQIIDSLK